MGKLQWKLNSQLCQVHHVKVKWKWCGKSRLLKLVMGISGVGLMTQRLRNPWIILRLSYSRWRLPSHIWTKLPLLEVPIQDNVYPLQDSPQPLLVASRPITSVIDHHNLEWQVQNGLNKMQKRQEIWLRNLPEGVTLAG